MKIFSNFLIKFLKLNIKYPRIYSKNDLGSNRPSGISFLLRGESTVVLLWTPGGAGVIVGIGGSSSELLEDDEDEGST